MSKIGFFSITILDPLLTFVPFRKSESLSNRPRRLYSQARSRFVEVRFDRDRAILGKKIDLPS